MDQKLIDAYQDLDNDTRLIADIATLIFETTSLDNLVSFFNAQVKKITKAKFKEGCQILQSTGIIEEYDIYSFSLTTQFKLWLYPQAVRNEAYMKQIQEIQLKLSKHLWPDYYEKAPLANIRNMFTGYFLDDKKLFTKSRAIFYEYYSNYIDIMVNLVDFPDYHGMILTFGPEYINNILLNARVSNLYNLSSPDATENLINKTLSLSKNPENLITPLRRGLSSLNLYRGDFSKANEYKGELSPGIPTWVQMTTLAYKGEYEKAIDTLNLGVSEIRKSEGNSKWVPESNVMVYYLLSILAWGEGYNNSLYTKLMKQYPKMKETNRQMILAIIYFAGNKLFEAKETLSRAEYNKLYLPPLEQFIHLIAAFLINDQFTPIEKIKADSLLKKSMNNGYRLFALELAWMLSSAFPSKENKKNLEDLQKSLGTTPMLSRIAKKEDWEKALEGLLNISSGKSNGTGDKTVDANRLAYLVDFDKSLIQPVLQTYSSKGWSKGRNIALKRMKERQLTCMSEQDNRIAGAIKHETSYYGSDYYIDFSKMLPELAGHPYLFYYQNPDIIIELVKTQPELITEKTSKGFVLRCDITEANQNIILKKETNTRYLLITLNDQQLSVIRALNKGKLVIPVSGKEQLLKAVSHLSNFMTVHSDMVATETSIKQIEGDPRIRVQLIPVSDTLKAECFVKPFGTIPPYSKPGIGGKSVYGILENEKLQAIRDLKTETNNFGTLLTALSETVDFDLSEGPVVFEDPHDCLSLLEVLKEQNEVAVVEWPEGERFRVRRKVSFNQLNLSVKGKGHWFEMEGELKIDEETVLSLKQLMDLTAKSKGHFVELGNGEFIALAEELKKRLDELRMFASTDKNGVKINKFAAPSIESLSETAGSFKADKHWKTFVKKIEAAGDKNFPVPSSLQAELRTYQEEGFTWLARLAEWEAGACLADDMGLGKTVQAIALLLYRAENGPALVVSPASVVPNWMSEVQRFAPSLNIHNLGHNNREEVLENLGSFDVLITTYGILQSEEEQMGKIKWNTVVLDEAQAIKNNQTKTSKAAMNIEAGFRLILTGTPLQNNLGELWNLFNFINPGLLGSLQNFNERFVTPVEKYGDMAPKQHLKKLIAPFILRRTKTNVLDELPPKTEITQKIELSNEEMAFYEALRRQAIENIELSESPAGQQHLKALAEITRLRMACCHPSLVNDTLELPSSKLNAFLEIMDELIENKHRALVFSQFIGHLALVRQALEKKGISYQYLDGSTPINDRAAIVKSFQSGKGEVFLISLKAGGLGLNLTAADYVIHMDPWWNPAIEDQASDRAYRIGQSRPVTIYRLVAQGTIEEKILQLHASKRDMAFSLLEGSDQSAKLSTSDLLNLLKEM